MVNVPVCVAGGLAVVRMLSVVVTGLDPAPVVTSGLVANEAVAFAGKPDADRVTLHWFVFPPTVSETV